MKAEARRGGRVRLSDPERFGRLGARMPRGFLLEGRSRGTLRSAPLARAVAGEAAVPFFAASGSSFDEKYVGVGARRVRDLFAAARAAAPHVFLDEVDAMGGSREVMSARCTRRGRHFLDSHTLRQIPTHSYPFLPQVHAQTLNALLVEMDGFAPNAGVVVLAATNQERRCALARLQFWRAPRPIRRLAVLAAQPGGAPRPRPHAPRPPRPHSPRPAARRRRAAHASSAASARNSSSMLPVDLDALARSTSGLTGADLANILNLAAAARRRRRRRRLGAGRLTDARDKVIMGLPRTSAVVSAAERRLKAYHEAGHVIVARASPAARPVEG